MLFTHQWQTGFVPGMRNAPFTSFWMEGAGGQGRAGHRGAAHPGGHSTAYQATPHAAHRPPAATLVWQSSTSSRKPTFCGYFSPSLRAWRLKKTRHDSEVNEEREGQSPPPGEPGEVVPWVAVRQLCPLTTEGPPAVTGRPYLQKWMCWHVSSCLQKPVRCQARPPGQSAGVTWTCVFAKTTVSSALRQHPPGTAQDTNAPTSHLEHSASSTWMPHGKVTRRTLRQMPGPL